MLESCIGLVRWDETLFVQTAVCEDVEEMKRIVFGVCAVKRDSYRCLI